MKTVGPTEPACVELSVPGSIPTLTNSFLPPSNVSVRFLLLCISQPHRLLTHENGKIMKIEEGQ